MSFLEIMGTIFCFLLMLSFLFNPMDSTDKSYWNRSGLSLYTDHKTGLQYLKAGMLGGITPRMDANGQHMREELK